MCQKHRGEVEMPGGVIYQDDLVFATHGKLPDGASHGYPGVLFVEPRRHVPGLGDLTRPEAERVGLVSSRLARALEQSEGAERTYVAVLGHHVPHLHVWLVPRYPGAPDHVLGLAVLEAPGAPQADQGEIAGLCQRIREHLAKDEAAS